MSGTNDFQTFGLASGANVMSQAAYVALAARTTGFSAGLATSAQLNKVWRQSSFVTSAIAQFMANQLNINISDDGNQSEFVQNFISAVASIGTNYQVYSASGSSGNWTVPAGVYRVYYRMVGGGGGGGAGGSTWNGGGGGAGAYTEGWLAVTPGATIPYTVGAAGAAGTGSTGGTGGTSYFNTTISAGGGSGGGGTSGNVAGGGPGTGAGGAFYLYGGYGADGGTSVNAPAGMGGASFFGGGGKGSNGTSTSSNALVPGSGGGGSWGGSAGNGGLGASGIIILNY